MLERAVRLPPSLPGEYTPTPVSPPVLPIEQTTRACFSLIAYGYAVAPRDRGTCPRAAALLDRHLLRRHAQQVDDDLGRGTELAREVAQPRSGPLNPALLLAPPSRLPRGAVLDFARRTFVPERQVVVNFSPFAG